MTYTQICRIHGHTYAYEMESYWDPKAQRTRRRTVRYLGRCDDDGKLLTTTPARVDHVHSTFEAGPLALFYAAAQDLEPDFPNFDCPSSRPVLVWA
ncbi:MAG: hypothetical protein ACREEC_01345 [Thermoplasmata archaeon]